MKWLKRLIFGGALFGALLLVGLVVLGWAVWSAMQGEDGTEDGPGLSCTATVTVAPATADVPAEALQRVAEAVENSGREVEVLPGYSTDASVLVHFVEGQSDHRSGGTEPVTLRLGAVPSVEHVADLLGERLTPCTEEAPEPVETPEVVQEEPASDISWLPWWPWPVASWPTYVALALIVSAVLILGLRAITHPLPRHLYPSRLTAWRESWKEDR